MAYDKLSESDDAYLTQYGIRDKVITDIRSDKVTVVQDLLVDLQDAWSTLLLRRPPYPDAFLRQIQPFHKVMLSARPRRTGCHVWRETSKVTAMEVNSVKPGLIVECYQMPSITTMARKSWNSVMIAHPRSYFPIAAPIRASKRRPMRGVDDIFLTAAWNSRRIHQAHNRLQLQPLN